ncbi:MAG: putative metal-binding motif-containing protein [Myxococcota bacterium]|nr:putative metal-binding motif-containing protein [Myxococcota bacterium]
MARLEIVLADAGKVETIEGQRLAPANFAGSESVRYYRQRATAGVIEGVGVADGFTVRIEPNIAMVPTQIFVPFLVAYDAQDNVVGVGAVLDENLEPTSITIEGGTARKYFVDMTRLKAMDPALGMGARESQHVVCGGDTQKWTSGIAWRPATTQLRLLLADRSQDASATDATERDADLDCDAHAADTDCDDLRSAFHPDRQDVCDGMDQNCDGARTTVQSCASPTCANGGVQLCDDRTGEPIGECVASSTCGCAGGACASCALTYKATSNLARKAPCAPAVGKMRLPNCIDGNTCTVEVLSATPPWVGYISTMPTSGFTTKLSGVIDHAYLELKLSGASDVMAASSVGTLHLLVTQSGQTRLVPVDIQLQEDGMTTTCQAIAGTGLYAMTCAP